MEQKTARCVSEKHGMSGSLNRSGSRRKKRTLLLSILLIAALGLTVSVYALTTTPMEKESGVSTQLDTIVRSKEEKPLIEQTSSVTFDSEKETIPEEKPVEAVLEYDYTKPVPESPAVENSYFDDAVFIGDSRTEGLLLNTGLSNGIAYTYKGLMVDTVFTKPVINKDGSKLSVMDALEVTTFDKVYIMLGINETGWPYSDIFIEKYSQIIDEIKRINPSATIYVQQIIPVTDNVSATHSYVKNEKIREYNELLQKMASEKQVYYVDTASAVVNSEGSLPEDAATDGIHLKKSYCEKWLEGLKTHTVSK